MAAGQDVMNVLKVGLKDHSDDLGVRNQRWGFATNDQRSYKRNMVFPGQIFFRRSLLIKEAWRRLAAPPPTPLVVKVQQADLRARMAATTSTG